MTKKISVKVVERLTIYHSLLTEYQEEGIEYISSPQIAARLNIDDSQVRKDFKILKDTGAGKRGYDVNLSKASIEKTLGFEKKKDAFIIGAGYLGLALAKYDNFASYGLNILALFDNDPLKMDMIIGEKQVFHITKLENMVKRLNVDIAILTVPRHQAQKVADIIVKSGMRYIWNFTPVVLKVPKHVKVYNQNIVSSFLQFSFNDIEG